MAVSKGIVLLDHDHRLVPLNGVSGPARCPGCGLRAYVAMPSSPDGPPPLPDPELPPLL